MRVKATELVRMLNEHIEKHGDRIVFIYDDYADKYKTFSAHHISTLNNNFVIECEQEEE